MSKIYLFENHEVLNLEPIVLTRPAFELRCGTYTFYERIRKAFPQVAIELIVRPELKELTKYLYPNIRVNPDQVEEGLWILGNVLWTKNDIELISNKEYPTYYSNEKLVAAYLDKNIGNNWLKNGGPVRNKLTDHPKSSEIKSKVITYLWDAVNLIDEAIVQDKTDFLPKPGPLDKVNIKNVVIKNASDVFIESIEQISPNVVIDATNGPVIISKNVTVNSFSVLEGPLFIGAGSQVKPHTCLKKCIIGPGCKVGGEISSTIFQGWSNKVHYGFVGNSYIGQWVNFGAGTTTSNLKNNYQPVNVTVNNKVIKTEELFIGLFAGDYTTFAIGSVLNTGTNIGPGCNIVNKGFPSKRIKPFTWLINGKQMKTKQTKFFQFAETIQKRRGKALAKAEHDLLLYILHNQ